MGSIAATNSSTPSTQSMLLQSRIDQARREADQAEARARDLRSQADDEQRKADQGNEQVRQLSVQQSQIGARPRAADPTYKSAVKAPASESPTHVEDAQALQTVAIAKSVSTFMAQAFASTNAAGKQLGRLLSVSA